MGFGSLDNASSESADEGDRHDVLVNNTSDNAMGNVVSGGDPQVENSTVYMKEKNQYGKKNSYYQSRPFPFNNEKEKSENNKENVKVNGMRNRGGQIDSDDDYNSDTSTIPFEDILSGIKVTNKPSFPTRQSSIKFHSKGKRKLYTPESILPVMKLNVNDDNICLNLTVTDRQKLCNSDGNPGVMLDKSTELKATKLEQKCISKKMAAKETGVRKRPTSTPIGTEDDSEEEEEDHEIKTELINEIERLKTKLQDFEKSDNKNQMKVFQRKIEKCSKILKDGNKVLRTLGGKIISDNERITWLKWNSELRRRRNKINSKNQNSELICCVCDKEYKYKARLAAHIRNLHGKTIAETLAPEQIQVTGSGNGRKRRFDDRLEAVNRPTERETDDTVSEQQIKKHRYIVIDTDGDEEDDVNKDDSIVDIYDADRQPLEDDADQANLTARKSKFSINFINFVKTVDKLNLLKPEDVQTKAKLLRKLNADLPDKLQPLYLRLKLADQLSKRNNNNSLKGTDLRRMLKTIMSEIFKNVWETKYKTQTAEERATAKVIVDGLIKRIVFSFRVPELLKNYLEAFIKNLTVCAMWHTVEAKRTNVSAGDVHNAAWHYCNLLCSQQYHLALNTVDKLKQQTFDPLVLDSHYWHLVLLGVYEILRKYKILKLRDGQLEYIDFNKIPHNRFQMKNMLRFLGECHMKNEYFKATSKYAFRFVLCLAVNCVTIAIGTHTDDELYNSEADIFFGYNEILKAVRMLNISFFQSNQDIFHMNGVYRHLPFAKYDEALKSENAIVDEPDFKYNNRLCLVGVDISQEIECKKPTKVLVKEGKAQYVKNMLATYTTTT